MSFRALAFDLDDTLIDTSGLLVGLASQAAFEAMKKVGLKMSYSDFNLLRKKKALEMNHKLIFHEIAKLNSGASVDALAEAGIQAFYNPPLPETISLLPGALENIKILKNKYSLFLITSGAVNTQQEKVKRAHLSEHFKKCFFVDGFKKERKRQAFLEIVKMMGCENHHLLSIGNRLSQEIHDAKEMGAKTCYFEYGEHVGEKPRNDYEIPDYKIQTHHELIPTCQL